MNFFWNRYLLLTFFIPSLLSNVKAANILSEQSTSVFVTFASKNTSKIPIPAHLMCKNLIKLRWPIQYHTCEGSRALNPVVRVKRCQLTPASACRASSRSLSVAPGWRPREEGRHSWRWRSNKLSLTTQFGKRKATAAGRVVVGLVTGQVFD